MPAVEARGGVQHPEGTEKGSGRKRVSVEVAACLLREMVQFWPLRRRVAARQKNGR